MIESTIVKLAARHDLSCNEACAAIQAIMDGQTSDAEIAAFLTALHMKGETVDEIVGAATAMRARAVPIHSGVPGLLDTCGTGGDGASTFNISTAAALVTAACGVPVAKHGNRGVSSRSGSADVLVELGVNIDVADTVVERCIREVGIGFCFAPHLHPAMRHAAPVRRHIKIRTIFNLLGPLTNPAGAEHQLMGVGRRDLVERLAEALRRLGTRHALVVAGADGLDEVTLSGTTFVCEVRGAEIRALQFQPADFGLGTHRADRFQVESAAESADRIRRVLRGEAGPDRAIVLANAAAALLAAERVQGLAEGVARAAAAIDCGAAQRTLDGLVHHTRQASDNSTADQLGCSWFSLL
jgi:anthranilate phosphoribosyltransferase